MVDAGKRITVIAIIGAIWFMVLYVVLLLIFRNKPHPFMSALMWWVILFFIVALVGTVVLVVWWLLKPNRVDMVDRHKKRVLESCMINRPQLKQELWFTGSNFLDSRKIGDVLGISYFLAAPQHQTEEELAALKEQLMGNPHLLSGEQADKLIESKHLAKKFFCVAFKQGMRKEIFLGTPEDFHGDFNGSRVWIKGSAFAPKIFDIYATSKTWLYTEKYDEVVTTNIKRYVLEDFLSELKTISDDLLAISPEHKKALEKSHMQELRVASGKEEKKG
jgi:hypothetical protein